MASLKIRQLEAFRAVMLTGSVTDAGEILSITQSSVSKLIAQLEAEMGIPLFLRVKGRLVPTTEASVLLNQVDNAFRVLEETTRNARKLAKGFAGHMKLVGFPALGLETIPRVLGRFLNTKPDITVDYEIRGSSYIEEWVSNRQVDLGIAAKSGQRAGVRHQALCELNSVCIMHPSHPLASNEFVSLKDINGERFIGLGRETVLRDGIDKALLTAKVTPVIVVECGASTVICNLVAAGAGLAIVDPFTALDAWRQEKVCVAKLLVDIPFRITALSPEGVPMSSLTKEFLEELELELGSVQKSIDMACRTPY